MKTLTLKTEDALSSKRAQAEIGSSQYEYKTTKRTDATIKVVMQQKYNGSIRQKTYYFKKK